ncbi:MAG: response regulator transcription factor [Lachnospiraceae bacterium]|nr:response regulator transcription factor [Lachnospiraceae bacterium]
MKKRVVVVENDPEYKEQIVGLIRNVYSKADIVIADNIAEGYKRIFKEEVSLVITSIEMGTKYVPDQSGIRLVQEIRKCVEYQFLPIIVVTRLKEFKSYMYQQMNCFGYFLKPLDEEAFKKTIARAFQHAEKPEKDKVFAVRKNNVYHVVKVEDVMYVDSYERTLHIHFTDGRVMEVSQKPIQYIMQASGSYDFIRCARGTLVNRKHMVGYYSEEQSVLMTDGKLVKVGRFYVNEMREVAKKITEYNKNKKIELSRNKYRVKMNTIL